MGLWSGSGQPAKARAASVVCRDDYNSIYGELSEPHRCRGHLSRGKFQDKYSRTRIHSCSGCSMQMESAKIMFGPDETSHDLNE